MATDQAIARAAGVIMWWLKRGGSDEEAIARAQKREPELKDSEIRKAWVWAQAANRVPDIAAAVPPGTTIAEILDQAGVPWRRNGN